MNVDAKLVGKASQFESIRGNEVDGIWECNEIQAHDKYVPFQAFS